MRELHLMADESTAKFFVLRDADGVSFQIARSEFDSVYSAAHNAPDAGAPASGSTIHPLHPAPTETEDAPAETPEPQEAPEPSEPSVPSDPSVPDDTPEYSALSQMAKQRPLPEPDPLLSTPLSLPPKEIQARIRAGATAAELAQEMGVAETRVDPYAHPVMLERAQIAEAAKQSHPVRDDGPAKLSLFEILATAFAARGHSLSEAEWDATRQPGDAWVVHLRWRAGLTENEAQWTLQRSMGATASTEARNGVAADLTDPNFVQPVRSLTAVSAVSADDGEAPEERNTPEANEADGETGAPADPTAPTSPTESTVTEGDFLQHPESQAPQKRRRKAVTPHWEDVLLGVRTNTKRPKK
ncbi:DUF3071 domain-containing protein [Corynebacterium godavarianum]|uniref:DUF3071 domain-containing protein n=1 Tax=Corynebacterium godavarianum TaxID=2054421 RepID=A0ABY3DY32_9CORY|nr:septation protein SepH [Corynebacterium godavarianum]MBL7285406.1 DUF3071 domain-containing protein [Corynebacterium godavarianum]TSJ70462.1 DUF3071 domain-containing protein [Corynebacterium godavarianum]